MVCVQCTWTSLARSFLRRPRQIAIKQALANHDTARALMMAMRAQSDPCTCALPGHSDTQDVADVALRVAFVAVPDVDMAAFQVRDCAKPDGESCMGRRCRLTCRPLTHHMLPPEAATTSPLLLGPGRSTPLPSGEATSLVYCCSFALVPVRPGRFTAVHF